MTDSHEPRLPGQWLDEQFRENVEARFYTGGLLVGVTISAIAVWACTALNVRSLPGIMFSMVFVTVAMFWLYWVKHKKGIRDLILGLSAERTVGAILADLGRMGYVARHDIQCERDGRTWNIDHLLIGPSGVYVIETKHRSKTDRGGTTVQYDGERIRVGDGPWDAAPIDQVQRNVRDIRAKLDKAGLSDVPVRGVVMFPGWSRIQGSSGKDIWVLMPSALEKWIRVEEGKVAKVSEERQRTVVAVIQN